ncbi:DUF934 domain-containing protein [Moraxella sp. ZJ142]|uniref:DUF934 domain-containing protein n=1 Tax=Moraxella marmotae TaxID=3344520 RepID=UPI0035D4FAA2
MSTIKVFADAKSEVLASEYDLEQALTADSTPDDIETAIKADAPLLFSVANFMDGRVFSLVRHARHKGFGGEIIIAGDFALDQANYFVKSGVDAFLVDAEQVPTLTKTLQDLATGYDGESVSRLPLFS